MCFQPAGIGSAALASVLKLLPVVLSCRLAMTFCSFRSFSALGGQRWQWWHASHQETTSSFPSQASDFRPQKAEFEDANVYASMQQGALAARLYPPCIVREIPLARCQATALRLPKEGTWFTWRRPEPTFLGPPTCTRRMVFKDRREHLLLCLQDLSQAHSLSSMVRVRHIL